MRERPQALVMWQVRAICTTLAHLHFREAVVQLVEDTKNVQNSGTWLKCNFVCSENKVCKQDSEEKLDIIENISKELTLIKIAANLSPEILRLPSERWSSFLACTISRFSVSSNG